MRSDPPVARTRLPSNAQMRSRLPTCTATRTWSRIIWEVERDFRRTTNYLQRLNERVFIQLVSGVTAAVLLRPRPVATARASTISCRLFGCTPIPTQPRENTFRAFRAKTGPNSKMWLITLPFLHWVPHLCSTWQVTQPLVRSSDSTATARIFALTRLRKLQEK